MKGKRFPKESSLWANPFKLGRDGSRESVIRKYKKYIAEKIATDPTKYDLNSLRGKQLGCWCISCEEGITTSAVPLECHGQVLLELLGNQ